MAKITFSRKEFEKHFKLTDELKEKINLFGTHFESADSENIELEILPNRPDLFSLQGFIRDLSAFLGKQKSIKNYKTEKPERNFEVKIDSNLKDLRPYTACAIVKNLRFDDEKIREIVDIQEKIHATLGRNRKKIAIGIYPLEKIKLPIKFEARAPKDIKFIPLEFDRELNGLQILQQHPTGREYAGLLEGKDKYPVFVDSAGEILSMPPVINSHKTGKITQETQEIFIECSGFDFEVLKKTLNILVVMLSEMGGKIYQMNLIFEHSKKKEITPNLEPEKIKFSLENANKLLGLNIKENELPKLLEKMGYSYNPKTKEVEVPAWRTDIMHEVDIIEDLAIAYGYENFIPEIPSISGVGEIDKKELVKKKIAEILAGLNFLETSSYHLLSLEEVSRFSEKPEIEVEDSKSEYKFLRNSLTLTSLNILSKNIDTEYPQRIFELGRVFEIDHKGERETGIKEPEKISICITSKDAGFTEMKQTLDYLMRMLNLEYVLEEGNSPFIIDGRCASIILKNKEKNSYKKIGFFGEVSPRILANLRIKMPVVCLELDVDVLI